MSPVVIQWSFDYQLIRAMLAWLNGSNALLILCIITLTYSLKGRLEESIRYVLASLCAHYMIASAIYWYAIQSNYAVLYNLNILNLISGFTTTVTLAHLLVTVLLLRRGESNVD